MDDYRNDHGYRLQKNTREQNVTCSVDTRGDIKKNCEPHPYYTQSYKMQKDNDLVNSLTKLVIRIAKYCIQGEQIHPCEHVLYEFRRWVSLGSFT